MPGDRHRQARGARGDRRPADGDRPRRRLLRRGGARAARLGDLGPAGRDPGLRQRRQRSSPRELAARGARIVAISDVSAGDRQRRAASTSTTRRPGSRSTVSCAAFGGGEAVGRSDVLEVPCDILVPAALESPDHAPRTPPRIDCRLIVEAANGPTTPEADEILADARDPAGSRRARQRRRGHRQLLRVGAGPAAIPVGHRRGAVRASTQYLHQGDRSASPRAPTRSGCRGGTRRRRLRSSASPRPPGCARSSREREL